MDVYKYMYKLAPSSADKVIADAGNVLPSGYVTDGMGNIYKVPTKGATPLISLEDTNKNIKFRYNWETAEIEIYVRNSENELGTNNYELFDVYSVNRENFCDGADYWFRQALRAYDEEIDNILKNEQVAEAYDVFGEYIDDDKDSYKYEIRIDYSVSDDFDVPDLEAFFKDIETTLANYDISYELFTQTIHVYAKNNDGIISLYVEFSMPLTKDDLIEIYLNYEEHMQKMLKNKNVTIEIDDIFEV